MTNIFRRKRSVHKPCRHMEGLLNRTADGTSRGFAKWYALAHAARCPGCRKFLEHLEEMIAQLKKNKGPEASPEALDRLTALVRESGE
ncbi:MAG: hypothetical protein KF784_15340 [Fimbriimonadaceae bacterium]|nr:hypothetical protein [Fimbriimonadaceae bacterium]